MEGREDTWSWTTLSLSDHACSSRHSVTQTLCIRIWWVLRCTFLQYKAQWEDVRQELPVIVEVGTKEGWGYCWLKIIEVFMLADSGIDATYGMAVEVAAQWLSSSDIQSARICPHFSSSEVAQDTYSVSVLGAVHILRNTGWGGGGSSWFITILHRGCHLNLLQYYIEGGVFLIYYNITI